MAGKRSRKRRGPAPAPSPQLPDPAEVARGYARSRQRDDEARAALVPLAPGERPRAVTVGAIVAALLSLANLVSTVFGYESDEVRKIVSSAIVTVILAVVAVGMWRARYWGVLGMQTLTALTIVWASLALLGAVSVLAALVLTAVIGLAGTLFWFLVKALARIQMPTRPGT
jgi:hypothetical protein